MTDISFPNKNEEKFIKIAKRLHTKELYFIYNYQKDIAKLKHKLQELQKTTKTKLKLGILTSPSEIPRAKKLCDFVITESSQKDQHTLEKLRPKLIFNFEKSEKKDKSHYRISGLNQVLCNLAAQNNITVAFSFSEILNASKKRRIIILGRIIQNLKFCKKYKVNTILASFAKQPFELRDEKTLKAISSVLQKNL
ncbi:hypothetical protein GOV06_04710 [Candidatus Woesearchaeota archaeon]|nr:hypothetical protein [Candidatus Woesearchaeota archaeon]